MIYAIDFDTRVPEAKGEDRELLEAYVADNDLSNVIALVDSADELCLQFSLKELIDLYGNMTHIPLTDKTDEGTLADLIWGELIDTSIGIPTFTPALGKKSIKAASKENKPIAKAKATKTPSARITLNLGDEIAVVDGKCKRGSILHSIVKAIDDELCGTVGEVLDYIVSTHVIPKTGELADVKFAEHNIKYFIKKGNVALEEEL